MTMNLQSNDYELFDLAPAFTVDRSLLDERWKALQKQAHPDRHAASDAQTQRLAMQWSVRINEAYQRLKDPLRRANYLCELNGAPVEAESNTAMPAEFLMQQMEWRETLEESDSLDQLESLADDVARRRQDLLKTMAQTADDSKDWTKLAGQVRALMFIQRFAQDVDNRLEKMDS